MLIKTVPYQLTAPRVTLYTIGEKSLKKALVKYMLHKKVEVMLTRVRTVNNDSILSNEAVAVIGTKLGRVKFKREGDKVFMIPAEEAL